MTETAQQPPRRAAELVILGTIFFDVVAIGIIIPVFPALVTSISGASTAEVAQLFGLFSATFGIMQFVGAPILGAASDHFGRRPVIVLSNLISGLHFVLMALAPNVIWLFVGRVISGLATGSMSAANAWIADMVPAERRAARFGLMGATMGLGFAIGPAIGGLLGSIDPRAPFWAAAAFSILNGLFGYFVLKESLPPERRTRFHFRHANPIGAIFGLVKRYPALGAMLCVSCLFNVAGFAVQTISVLYTEERYDWGPSANGLMMMGFGLAGMVVQVALVRPAIKLLGNRLTLILGLSCQVAGSLIFGLATTGVGFWIGIPIASLGSLAGPVWTSLMTQTVGPMEQGRLSGVTSSLMSLMSIAAPLIYAMIFASAIRNPDFPGGIGAPFFLSAALMASAVGLAAWITSRPTPAGPMGVDINPAELVTPKPLASDRD